MNKYEIGITVDGVIEIEANDDEEALEVARSAGLFLLVHKFDSTIDMECEILEVYDDV